MLAESVRLSGFNWYDSIVMPKVTFVDFETADILRSVLYIRRPEFVAMRFTRAAKEDNRINFGIGTM